MWTIRVLTHTNGWSTGFWPPKRTASIWLAEWLDVARYSDTDGFLHDSHNRYFWPWRDWVISAFNRNMPFDQFSTWQLAGDLLAHGTTPTTHPEGLAREQTLATAFLRLNRRNSENGAIDEEWRVEATLDRAETIGKAFLGLTVGCARCHDHKYDPISQQNYYELVGFFNSVDEPGFYSPGNSAVQGGPTLIWTDAETDRRLADAEAEIRDAEAAFEEARESAMAGVSEQVGTLLDGERAELVRSLDGSIADTTVAYYSFDRFIPFSWEAAPEPLPQSQKRIPPTSIVFEPNLVAQQSSAAPLATGRLPWGMNTDLVQFLPNEIETEGNTLGIVEAPILGPGVRGDALFFNDTNRGLLGRDIGWKDRTDDFAFDLWLLAAREYEDSLVIDHRDDDNSGASGYQLHLENNHLRFRLTYSWPYNMLEIVSREPVRINDWTHVTVTYDGSSRAEGIGLYVDGELAEVEIRKNHLTRTILPMSYSAILDPFVGMVFGKRFRQTGLVDGGALDEIRVFDRALTSLEVRFLHDGESALEMNPDTLSEGVTEWAVALDPAVVRAKNRLHEAREVENQIVSVVPEVMVMGDTPEPRQAYILDRGLYNQRRDPVDPRGTESVFPWDGTLPWEQDRVG